MRQWCRESAVCRTRRGSVMCAVVVVGGEVRLLAVFVAVNS